MSLLTAIEDRHPDMDAWLYRVETEASKFGAILATLEPESSTRHVKRREVEDTVAFQKYDCRPRDLADMAGARDKIASDLAQLMGVNVPGTLLWKEPVEIGCVQKEPVHQQLQTLKSLKRAIDIADELDRSRMLNLLCESYDPMNVVFDVWVCNVDRATNLRNTLLAETSAGRIVWLIDFDCSLSHDHRPWSQAHEVEHGFQDVDPPLPELLVGNERFLQKVRSQKPSLIDRLNRADDVCIDLICSRAVGFYGRTNSEEKANRISKCLKSRKTEAVEWTCQLLNL